MDAQLTGATSLRANWPERCQRVALVLQGGGALGAYQAGVYEALHEADIAPNWVSGVSIGAINAAIIAGNPPALRIKRLKQFWETVAARDVFPLAPDGDVFRRWRNVWNAWMTSLLGQPGFFEPRFPGPLTAFPGAKNATSFYDSYPLRETLLELVDFRRLNDKENLRFSVGAVNVATGNFAYFDNSDETIVPEHIMASGALPPALPMVRIGTDSFWDGGIVSNTPLQHLLDQDDSKNTLVFQVDLFSARGPMPRDIEEVMARHKDILYSSRTRMVTDVFAERLRWKKLLHEALMKIPTAKLSAEERAMRNALADLPEVTILQLIYQQKSYESSSKDYEFSPISMREHWQSGREDTLATLKHKRWLQIPPQGSGVVMHDIHHDRV